MLANREWHFSTWKLTFGADFLICLKVCFHHGNCTNLLCFPIEFDVDYFFSNQILFLIKSIFIVRQKYWDVQKKKKEKQCDNKKNVIYIVGEDCGSMGKPQYNEGRRKFQGGYVVQYRRRDHNYSSKQDRIMSQNL